MTHTLREGTGILGAVRNIWKSNRSHSTGAKQRLAVLGAGVGAALLVSFALAMAALACAIVQRSDLWLESRPILYTFAWMFLYYLIPSLPLGLLIAYAVPLLWHYRPGQAGLLLPIVSSLLLSLAAVVDAAASSPAEGPRSAILRMGTATAGIAAAIGVGAVFAWLQKRRLGPWLLRTALVMALVSVPLLALGVQLRNHLTNNPMQRIGTLALLLAGVVFSAVLAWVSIRMSPKQRRIWSIIYGLACSGLLLSSLVLGEKNGIAGNSGNFSGQRPAPVVSPASHSAAPNVLLISIDTLRADRLSCYGNPRRTSPAIDSVASQGILFKRTYSTSSWTLPSHASMLTGLYTATHGADKIMDPKAGRIVNPIAAGVPTLAEKLRDRGYRTAGFISNPWVSSVFGFGRGFEHYDDRTTKRKAFLGVKDSLLCRTLLKLGVWDEQDFDGSRRVDETLSPAIDWIEKHSAEPFFLFLHFIEPHFVYEPPEKYRLDSSGKPIPVFTDIEPLLSGRFSLPADRQSELNALYEGEIRYLDDRLSELFLLLDHKGLTGHTLLIITSDHGESLGEHGLWTHGNSLYDEQLHVPLIMRLPGAIPAGLVVDRKLASLVDLMPTILDVIGAPPLQAVQGQSLKAAWEGHLQDEERSVYAELRPDSFWRRLNASLGRGMRMMLTPQAKYIEWYEGKQEVYFMGPDPLELNNAVSANPELARELGIAMRAWQARTLPAGDASRLSIDPEMMKQLKALGYIK